MFAIACLSCMRSVMLLGSLPIRGTGSLAAYILLEHAVPARLRVACGAQRTVSRHASMMRGLPG
eukprot:3709197-Rhodomonas_salina.2